MTDTIIAVLGVIILPLFLYILRKIDHMESLLRDILLEIQKVKLKR